MAPIEVLGADKATFGLGFQKKKGTRSVDSDLEQSKEKRKLVLRSFAHFGRMTRTSRAFSKTASQLVLYLDRSDTVQRVVQMTSN